ncbi:aminotransferase class V-fold PLP-dependent enzyme (plasmid) [Streptomycetaceae bacterium NBC_01309]
MNAAPDWNAVRRQFPAVGSTVYLNTAGGAPIPRSVAAAGARFYEEMRDAGDVMWPAWLERVEQVRHQVADFLNADPRSIAFAPSSSAAMNVIAGYLRGAGITSVVSMADSFPSIVVPLKHWGFDVSWVPSAADGTVDLETVASYIEPQSGALVVSSVEYGTSFAHDLDGLNHLCREHKLSYIVDATQSLGAFPLDVRDLDVDFVVASTYKWLLGGYGLAVFYVGPRWLEQSPPIAGWASTVDAPDALSDLALKPSAAAIEVGCPNFPAIFALGAALDFLGTLGASAVADRVCELREYLVARVQERGFKISSSVDPKRPSGIVHVAVDDPERVTSALRERGVFVSAKGLGLRVSVYLYNSFEDIDRFADVLAEATDRR